MMSLFSIEPGISSRAMLSEETVPGEKKKGKKSRAEKSRYAAKARRDKENTEMQNLIEELPLDTELLEKMDKASVIRLAVCYIKLKHFIQKDMALARSLKNGLGRHGNSQRFLPLMERNTAGPEGCRSVMPVVDDGKLMLDAVNGFLIYISRKGKITFVSPSVEEHLGMKQVQMIGRNVAEFVHADDQVELLKQIIYPAGATSSGLASADCSFSDENRRLFYVRMPYNLTKHGSKSKQTGYMLVQWSGKLKTHFSQKSSSMVLDGLLCICRPMQTTSVMEIRMDGNMFMSRHGLDMRFTYCDARIVTLIGYEPNEVIGKTAYQFHNPLDAPKVSDCHSKLIVNGTSVSKYYRFIGKTGVWVWVQTRATIIYNTSNKPQYVVCMNYIIRYYQSVKQFGS